MQGREGTPLFVPAVHYARRRRGGADIHGGMSRAPAPQSLRSI